MPSAGRQPPGRQPHGGVLYPPSSGGQGQRSYHHRPAGDFGLGDVSTRSRAPKQGRGWEHSEGPEWCQGRSERETLAPPGNTAGLGLPSCRVRPLLPRSCLRAACARATATLTRALPGARAVSAGAAPAPLGAVPACRAACCHLPVSLLLFLRRGGGYAFAEAGRRRVLRPTASRCVCVSVAGAVQHAEPVSQPGAGPPWLFRRVWIFGGRGASERPPGPPCPQPPKPDPLFPLRLRA